MSMRKKEFSNEKDDGIHIKRKNQPSRLCLVVYMYIQYLNPRLVTCEWVEVETLYTFTFHYAHTFYVGMNGIVTTWKARRRVKVESVAGLRLLVILLTHSWVLTINSRACHSPAFLHHGELCVLSLYSKISRDAKLSSEKYEELVG